MSDIMIKRKKISRRAFFKHSTGIAAGAAATTVLLPGLKETANLVARSVGLSVENDTLTMHNDLQRALEKPMDQRKWAMVIDIRKCIGCNACTAACIAENNLPMGVTYRTVAETEFGEYPDLRRFFMPTNCMQCEKAPCIEAANKVIPGSMARRPDGIVVIDYKKMKGKKVFEAASKACPYPKSLWYDEGKNYTDGTPAMQPYEKRKVKEYGVDWNRKDTRAVTRKCHFCTQRIDAGVLPACVTTCTGQAMHFGDLNDEESLISKLLRKNKSTRMNLASGAEPKIHYLDDDPEQTCMVCHS
jgi:molybdopterin-containing oxidoreductase family iron-sulfur binding subunit